MAQRKLPWSQLIAFVAIAGIVLAGVLAGALAGASPQGILTNVGFYASIAIIFAVLALGFNLQWGYTGLFNAGIAGFYLIGAYTMAIAITAPSPPIVIGGIPVYPGHLGGYSLPLAIGAILAMFAAGGAAAIIALPALRLRADYLAIATLAFASILQIFANNLQSVTGGAIGITGIPKPIAFLSADAPFLNAITIVGIGSAILLAFLLLLQFMAESPWGRVLRAVREDEEATMALGKNTFNYKLQAFALGGALMGLAGALFAVTLGYVSPSSSFAPAVTFSVWVMVIVGGSGNNRGVIVGAFLIYGLEWLSVQLKDYVPIALAAGLPTLHLLLIVTGFIAVITVVLIVLLSRYRPTTAGGQVLRKIQGHGWARTGVIGAFALYGLGWAFVFLEQYKPGAIGDTIFYTRLMLIGVLLIILIIYRPEGILREHKRVLR
ncbi:MAG TPA: branched-chain amino acid ABC transporter permease [Thermoplasmata archaeon]|nr:branched-chain amino acid ABC transporter permease [Thermoplasmata archaeon]